MKDKRLSSAQGQERAHEGIVGVVVFPCALASKKFSESEVS